MSRGAPRPGFRVQSGFLEEDLVAQQSLDGPRGKGRGGKSRKGQRKRWALAIPRGPWPR